MTAATLSELATPIVVTATPDTTATQAAQLMRTHHVGSLVVVEEGAVEGRPLGIVTDRDLVLAVLAEELDPGLFTVGDVMTTDLVTVSPQTGVLNAVTLMREHRLRRLVVVDDAGRVVGIATLEDVLDALSREFADLALALRKARDRERMQRR
jgi:CBS domain-containing protein